MLALVIPSDSNFDEVNNAKVQKSVYKLSTNVKFLEVLFQYIYVINPSRGDETICSNFVASFLISPILIP